MTSPCIATRWQSKLDLRQSTSGKSLHTGIFTGLTEPRTRSIGPADPIPTPIKLPLSPATSAPADGTYWLDTTNSVWGINEWNIAKSAFTKKATTVITDTVFLEPESTVPLPSYGSIGDYAVVATNVYNPQYYKRGGPTTAQAPHWIQDTLTADELYNTWVLVGSDDWRSSLYTAVGSNTNPVVPLNSDPITYPNQITINSINTINFIL